MDQGGGGDHVALWSAYSEAEDEDVIQVRNGNYTLHIPDTFSVRDVLIKGEDRNLTRLIVPNNPFLYLKFIHFESVNFTTGASDEESTVRYYYGNFSVTNCSSDNIAFEFFSWFLFNYHFDISFSNNSFWHSRIVLPEFSSADVDSYYYSRYRQSLEVYIFENNTCNGRPLLFLSSVDGIHIPSLEGGLILFNCTNITISNAGLAPDSNGITLLYCDNITIDSCVLQGFEETLFFGSTENVSITNCSIGRDNAASSFLFKNCRNLSIRSNSIFSSITISVSDGTDILNNTFQGTGELHLKRSDRATIVGNSFKAGGIFLELDDQIDPSWEPGYTVLDNFVHGKPIIYLVHQSDVLVSSDAGQVFLLHCTNITIRDLDASRVSVGIFAFNTSSSLVQHCTFSDISIGILLRSCSDLNVVSCTFSGIDQAITAEDSIFKIAWSIFLDSSVQLREGIARIENCSFRNAGSPHEYDAIYNDGDLVLRDSEISGYYNGVFHEGGSLTMTNSTIHLNVYGIYLERYRELFMDGCAIFGNEKDGIQGKDCEAYSIQNSRFSNNGGYGVRMTGHYSELVNVTVEGNLEGGIMTTGYMTTISHCIVRNNRGAGITGGRYIDNCTIEGNDGGVDGNWLNIEHSMIINNTEYGIRSTQGSGRDHVSNSTISGSWVGVHMDHGAINLSHCNIAEAVIGIFIIHSGTRQRVSQHRSRLMVISDPPRPPGRQQTMSTMRSILGTHRAFQTARTELAAFIAGSPSITILERELHDSETYLERTQFRQPDGEGPTWNDVDRLRERIDRIKNARSLEAEISHWMERLTTYRRQLESIDGSSPRVAPYLKRWTYLHQTRTNCESARAFLDDAGAISRENEGSDFSHSF